MFVRIRKEVRDKLNIIVLLAAPLIGSVTRVDPKSNRAAGPAELAEELPLAAADLNYMFA